MARWLVDSDVLLDVVLEREAHVGPSRRVLDLLREGAGEAFVAWHTVSNLYYNARKGSDATSARAYIASLLDFVEIAPTTTDDLHQALTLPMADFEDAMQVAAARACDARFIVTRNVRDFAQSPIPSITPADGVAELSR